MSLVDRKFVHFDQVSLNIVPKGLIQKNICSGYDLSLVRRQAMICTCDNTIHLCHMASFVRNECQQWPPGDMIRCYLQWTLLRPRAPFTNFNPSIDINLYNHYILQDEIIYPFPNFNGYTVDVWEWMNNFMPHLRMEVIIYPCWNKSNHADVIPRYWPFVWGIHRSPVNSPHKGQWRGALVFALICPWTNGWPNHRDVGDLRRHRTHYYVIVMESAGDRWIPHRGTVITQKPFPCHDVFMIVLDCRHLFSHPYLFFHPYWNN